MTDIANEAQLPHLDATSADPAPSVVDGAGQVSRSLLSDVFGAYDAAVDAEEIVLSIPGRGDKLAARYRVLDEATMRRIEQSKDTSAVSVNAGFIAEACVGLLARNRDGELVDLLDDRGRPLRYDKALADMLGQSDLSTARDVVQFVFRHNALAIGRHGDKLINWMTDTSAEVEGAVLGK